MNEQQVIEEFKAAGALLSGHFILSSGLHSPNYMQCARVLMDARRGERLCKALAEKIINELDSRFRGNDKKGGQETATPTGGSFIDIVVAPAMGGVVVGYEMGRQLGIPAMFVERVEGKFELRRGFTLEEGQKVLVVEDVVTTGKSSMEAVECIKAYGAQPVAVASLVDRRAGNDTTLALPLISLLKMDIPTYKPDALPAELQAIPAIKPGSRPKPTLSPLGERAG